MTGFELPTREMAHSEAHRRLATIFQHDELVWIIDEVFNAHDIAWNIDILRQGDAATWVQARYRYDAQADVIHYRGERALSSTEFRTARQQGRAFTAHAQD